MSQDDFLALVLAVIGGVVAGVLIIALLTVTGVLAT